MLITRRDNEDTTYRTRICNILSRFYFGHHKELLRTRNVHLINKIEYALLCSSSSGDLRSTQHHWQKLSVRPVCRKLTTSKGDNRETCFLLQRLSITKQRFNSLAFTLYRNQL